LSLTEDHLDELSYINLTDYYEEELRQVLNGAKVTEVFNRRERNNLRSAGILSLKNGDWFLTSKAKEMILE
jgi:hypothetical protein